MRERDRIVFAAGKGHRHTDCVGLGGSDTQVPVSVKVVALHVNTMPKNVPPCTVTEPGNARKAAVKLEHYGAMLTCCVPFAVPAQVNPPDWRIFGFANRGGQDIEMFYSASENRRNAAGHIEVWAKGLPMRGR